MEKNLSSNLNPDFFRKDLPPAPPRRTLDNYQKGRDDLTGNLGKNEFEQPFREETQVDNWISVLEGIQEKNTLNLTYFSKQNVDVVLKTVRYEIWQETKDLIDMSRQSIPDLVQIMRVIYLEHSEFSHDLEHIKKEIVRLNKIVVEQLKPRVITQIKQYKDYIRDISQVRTPNPLPQATSVAGTKALRDVTDILAMK
jgi:hypothetical protein